MCISSIFTVQWECKLNYFNWIEKITIENESKAEKFNGTAGNRTFCPNKCPSITGARRKSSADMWPNQRRYYANRWFNDMFEMSGRTLTKRSIPGPSKLTTAFGQMLCVFRPCTAIQEKKRAECHECTNVLRLLKQPHLLTCNWEISSWRSMLYLEPFRLCKSSTIPRDSNVSVIELTIMRPCCSSVAFRWRIPCDMNELNAVSAILLRCIMAGLTKFAFKRFVIELRLNCGLEYRAKRLVWILSHSVSVFRRWPRRSCTGFRGLVFGTRTKNGCNFGISRSSSFATSAKCAIIRVSKTFSMADTGPK